MDRDIWTAVAAAVGSFALVAAGLWAYEQFSGEESEASAQVSAAPEVARTPVRAIGLDSIEAGFQRRRACGELEQYILASMAENLLERRYPLQSEEGSPSPPDLYPKLTDEPDTARSRAFRHFPALPSERVAYEGAREQAEWTHDAGHAYLIFEGELLIFDTSADGELEPLSQVPLTNWIARPDGGDWRMEVAGDLLFLVRAHPYRPASSLEARGRRFIHSRQWSATEIVAIDISDRSAPDLYDRLDMTGRVLQVRATEGGLEILARDAITLPAELMVHPRDEIFDKLLPAPRTYEDAESRQAFFEEIHADVVAILSSRISTTGQDLLPRIDHPGGQDDASAPSNGRTVRPLHACTDLHLPRDREALDGLGALSLLELGAGSGDSNRLDVGAATVVSNGLSAYGADKHWVFAHHARGGETSSGALEEDITQLHIFSRSEREPAGSVLVRGAPLGEAPIGVQLRDRGAPQVGIATRGVRATDGADEKTGWERRTFYTLLERGEGEELRRRGEWTLPGEDMPQAESIRRHEDYALLETAEDTPDTALLSLTGEEAPGLAGELDISTDARVMPAGPGRIVTLESATSKTGGVASLELRLVDLETRKELARHAYEEEALDVPGATVRTEWARYFPEASLLAVPMTVRKVAEFDGKQSETLGPQVALFSIEGQAIEAAGRADHESFRTYEDEQIHLGDQMAWIGDRLAIVGTHGLSLHDGRGRLVASYSLMELHLSRLRAARRKRQLEQRVERVKDTARRRMLERFLDSGDSRFNQDLSKLRQGDVGKMPRLSEEQKKLLQNPALLESMQSQ